MDRMKKLQLLMLIVFLIAIAFSHTPQAATIVQCVQPDGTIEFSNQGCSKSNTRKRKKVYNAKNKRASSKLNISRLQNRILKSTTADEMETHALQIIDKVSKTAQKGQLRIACNAIASTYAKLARQRQQQHRKGQPVNPPSANMQMLFEEIMLAEAAINTADELDREITRAWEKYRTSQQQLASSEM